MSINFPNILTLGRIALILPFAVLYFHGSAIARWESLAVFLIAAATDWFDGYLARRLNQGSALGRMLDPIADKLLVVSAIMMLVATGEIAGWAIAPALAILLREIAVSGFREHLGPLGIVVPVSRLAKWKTASQLIAMSVLIAPVEVVQPVGEAILWVAAIITLVTGWSYFRATLRSVS
ncbi:MAG: CDP-diacylglycerol--glycerol-3-phosphate 3-phosphatidyltransferase [Rhodospirillales bacterium]|nr:CDP-diacylglycerol--glycerol-3-phosphate 3-phosphatidyltransferase [Rhodospirillales bacterium]